MCTLSELQASEAPCTTYPLHETSVTLIPPVDTNFANYVVDMVGMSVDFDMVTGHASDTDSQKNKFVHNFG